MAGRTDLEQLVWQMSADIRTLEKQNRKAVANVDQTANKIESRYKAVGKIDVGQFLDKTFDRTRLAAFDAGSARIPIFGQALEALGPIGIAAAAGVGLAALAVTQAIGAMRFADEIDDAAQKLNIGTEALQEYRFALTEVGGEAKDADAAIEGFQKKLGEGMAGGKAKKWFERLGFGGDDLKAFDSTEDALNAVLDRISKLGTEAERAAVAEKLGLGPMVALAREGSGKLEELRQKARDLGIVMDADLVKKGADANQEFETMAKVIDVNLKSAIVDLAPAIVGTMKLVAAFARALNDAADTWRRFEDKSGDGLDEQARLAVGNQNRLTRQAGGFSNLSPSERAAYDRFEAIRRRIDAEQRQRRARTPAGDKPDGEDLIDLSGSSGSKGKSGPSAQELADRRAQLERTLAVEIARLTNNQDLVRTLEREADLASRIKAYDDAGLSLAEATTRATADQVKLDEAKLDASQRSLVISQRAFDIEFERTLGNERFAQAAERRRDLEAAINALMGQGLDLVTATGLAKLNQLDMDRARAVAQARVLADAAAEHQLTLARLDADTNRVRVLERADAIRQRARKIEADNRWNFGQGDGQATTEVDEEIAAQSRAGFRDGVKGLLEELRSGGLEGVLTNVFDRVTDRLNDRLADLLTDVFMGSGKGSGGSLLAALGSAVKGKIPGFASGTDNAPAGLAYVHKGEVLTNMAGGTRVIPAAQVRQAVRVPAASARIGAGGNTFIVHAEGAVMAAGLVSELKAHAAQVSGMAASAGGEYGRAAALRDLRVERTYSRARA